MPVQASCDHCSATVKKIFCEHHQPVKCDSCDRITDRVLCEDCAEDEYGADDETRAPDEDDVIDFINDHVSADIIEDVSAAVRRSDNMEAEALLDRLASYVPGWADRVSLGRYSWRAKAA